MDVVMGFKDHVLPTFLINSQTDFNALEMDFQIPEETDEDDSSPADFQTTTGSYGRATKVVSARKAVRKKRKYSEAMLDHRKVIEIFKQKWEKEWEKDQERHDAELAFIRQFIEQTKRGNEEILACLRDIAESVAKLAKGI